MNTEQYRCLVFDWDGTLIDSIERIVTSLQTAGRNTCGHDIPEQAARDVIGMGLMEAIEQLLPGLDASLQQRAAEAYKQDYLHDSEVPCPLFDGVHDCLQDLQARGFTLAIATGKSRPGLDRALADSEMEHFFTTTRCAGEYPSKPQPDMLLSIIDDYGFETAHTLMIGDSEHDLRMANNARVDAIAVTHGAHDAEVLQRHQPIMCLDHITEISDVLSHNCLTL